MLCSQLVLRVSPCLGAAGQGEQSLALHPGAAAAEAVGNAVPGQRPPPPCPHASCHPCRRPPGALLPDQCL